MRIPVDLTAYAACGWLSCWLRPAEFGQKQSLEVFLQVSAFGCVSGLSPDGNLMGQRDKPRAPISGPSW